MRKRRVSRILGGDDVRLTAYIHGWRFSFALSGTLQGDQPEGAAPVIAVSVLWAEATLGCT